MNMTCTCGHGRGTHGGREQDFICDHDAQCGCSGWSPGEATEPTPQRPHTETWRRGDDTTLMYVREDGTVQCSAELLRGVLSQAGWERAE